MANSHKLLWKLNRLRTMTGGEIGWRVRQALQARLERKGIGLAQRVPAARARWGRAWLDRLPAPADAALYVQAAERILAGRFDVFALRGAELGFPPRWNRDPKTGIDAPLKFGKTLNYRDERLVGDIKYLWEPNRHYELVTLAQAFHLSGRERYALACRTLLESWFEQAPYPLGQAWTSSLENAIRLVNWAVAWHLLGGAESALFAGEQGEAFRQRWLQSIYRHCHFIAGHLSFHSSANNHLFGEYMGLLIAGLTWPCWENSAQWRELARQGLESEALKQNAPDGVNREQGIWYHHEVADMMLLCALFAKQNGIAFSDAYWARLEAMLEFIVAMMDVAGNVPMIGDADDALMVRFSQEAGFNPYRSLLASGAVLFTRADFKLKAGRFDDKNRWLLGERGAAEFDALDTRESLRIGAKRSFPDGGYYILGDAFDSARELRIVADAGALGYLSIAAHGHADALAFTLSAAGQPLLIDPGTYAYHTQKQWRDYFRGTGAHNTVKIDGMDQSEPGGNFMWLRKANARCELWETGLDSDCFIGSHDGYLRLADPVLHRRKILLLKKEMILVVEDILECRKQHDIEISWHFSDACKLEVGRRAAVASCRNIRLEMSMPDSDGELQMARGREEPPLGWISRRFDEKTPSPSLVWKERIDGSVRRVTRIRVVMG